MQQLIVTDLDFLRKPCDEVLENEFLFLKEKLKGSFDLYNKLYPENPGVGLAAPQIGISKKACYIQNGNFELFLFNPVIKDAYDFIQFREGCLSVPNRRASIKRFNHVLIESSNYPNGIILSESNAVIAQHEIDHLNGILIVDRLQTVVNQHKISRNSPCSCGSGKKFKKCCLS